LVHDSDAGADKGILSLPAELGDLGERQACFARRRAHAHKGQRGRDFDGRGGTESRADWDFAVHQQVRCLQFETAPQKDAGDAKHIVTPTAGAALGQVVEIKLEIAREFLGVDHELAVRSCGDR
jgi:hypothetical protein